MVGASVFGCMAALLVAPASAKPLPSPGGECTHSDFSTSIAVEKTSSGTSAPYSFRRVKASPRADTLVCVPISWNPEVDPKDWGTVGTWVWNRWPVRLPWDKEDYNPDSEHDPCRLQAFSAPGQPLSDPTWTLSDYDRRARGYLPSVGDVRGLMVTVADQPLLDRTFGEPGTRGHETSAGYFNYVSERSLAPFAEDYYWNASRGRMRLSMEVDRNVHVISSDLLESLNTRDVLTALDDEVDFQGVDFVVIQVPRDGRSWAPPPMTPPLTLDGADITSAHVLFRVHDEGVERRDWTLVHEIGHLLGLPDLYAEMGSTDNAFANRFSLWNSVMDGYVPAGFTGYERWLLGWMPTRNVRCVLPKDGYSTRVEMTSVDSLTSTGLKMIMFPVPDEPDRLRVMEVRSNDGTTSGFGRPGVLNYEVFASSPTAQLTTHPDCLVYDTAYQCSRAPFTSFREDWSTLERTVIPTSNAERRAYFDEALERYGAARDESVHKRGDSGWLWTTPSLRIEDLQVTDGSGITRATMRYVIS